MDSNAVTIFDNLQSTGYAQKLGAERYMSFTERKKSPSPQIITQRLAQHRVTLSHKISYRIITKAEKWCLYINTKQRKDRVSLGGKQELHPKKTMICMVGLGGSGALENAGEAQLYRANETIQ